MVTKLVSEMRNWSANPHALRSPKSALGDFRAAWKMSEKLRIVVFEIQDTLGSCPKTRGAIVGGLPAYAAPSPSSLFPRHEAANYTAVERDYVIATDHVLPTEGMARLRAGLTALDFVKVSWVVEGELEAPALAKTAARALSGGGASQRPTSSSKRTRSAGRRRSRPDARRSLEFRLWENAGG